MLVGRTDVPKGMTPGQAARKPVLMNVGDVASKDVQLRAVMVSLGLPRPVTSKLLTVSTMEHASMAPTRLETTRTNAKTS